MPQSNSIFGSHQVLSLAGDGHIAIGANASYQTSAFTVEAWMDTSVGGPVFTAVDNNGHPLYAIRVDDEGVVSIDLAGTVLTAAQGSALSENRWRHLAVTYDGHNTIKLYVSGDLTQTFTQSHSGQFPVAGVTIGRDSTGGFNGDLSAVRFWSVARSQSDISRNRYGLMPASTSGLIGAWLFQDGTAKDSSPIGNDGDSAGTVTWPTVDLLPSYRNYQAVYRADAASTTLPGIPAYNFGTGDFSLAAWVRTLSGGVIASHMPVPTDAVPHPAGFKLIIGPDGSLIFVCGDGTDEHVFASEGDLDANDGDWHHVGAVRKSGALILYLDGVPVSAPGLTCDLNITPTNPDEPLAFGVRDPKELMIQLPDSSLGDLIPQAMKGFNLSLGAVSLWNIGRNVQDIYQRMKVRLVGNEPGLVGYWNFNTGNIADCSPNLNLSLLTNAAAMAISQLDMHRETFSLGLTSDSSPCVTVPAIPAYEIGQGDFTLEVWIQAQTHGEILVLCADENNKAAVSIQAGGVIAMEMVASGSSATYSSQANTPVLNGAWHHVTVVRQQTGGQDQSQGGYYLYLDGALVGQHPLPATVASIAGGTLYLGGDSDGKAGYTGHLDAVRFWNTARDQPQIQAHRNYDLAGDEKGLIGAWRFETGICHDVSPNANNGDVDVTADVTSSPVPLSIPVSEVMFTQEAGYLDFGNAPMFTFSGTNTFTLEAWISPTAEAISGTVLSHAPNGEVAYGIAVQEGVLQVTRAGDVAYGVTVLQPGHWYHVASVYDGAKLTLFVNGVAEGATPAAASLSSNAGHLTAGAALDAQSQPVSAVANCALAFVRVWNSARSATDLNDTLYQLFGGAETGIAGMWNFTITSARDFTANGNNAVFHGNACWSRTDFLDNLPGRAFLVQNADSAIDCGTADNLAFTDAVTVECWVKVKSFDLPDQVFVSKGDGFQLRRYQLSNKVCFYTKGLSQEELFNPNPGHGEIEPGVWNHVAGVYDRSTGVKLLYINGEQAFSTSRLTGTLDYGANPHMTIGKRHGDEYSFNNGWMREVRVWNTARSAEDIALHWHRKVSGKLAGADADLKGYWSLSEPQSTVTDLSQNDNPGIPGTAAFIGLNDLTLAPSMPTLQAQSRLIQTWGEADARQDNADGTTVYQTVLTMRDANDNPTPGRRIRIWAESDITLTVGDVAYAIGPDQSAMFRTDATGRLTVSSQADSLATAALKIWADFMPKDHRVVILPDDHLHNTLSKITETTLTSPRAGQPALFDPSNESLKAAAGPVAQAIKQAMGTIKKPDARGARFSTLFMATGPTGTGAVWQHPDVQSHHYQVQGDEPYERPITPGEVPNWSIDFSGSEPVVTDHTHEEVQTLMASIDPIHINALPLDHHLLTSLSSLWDDFKNGVKKAAKVVISAVEDAVHVVVDWVDEAVKSIKVTLTSAYQVGEAVFGFLSQTLEKWGGAIADIARKVVDFFRNIFEWDDIVRTQQVLSTVLNKSFNVTVAMLQSVQAMVDSFFDGLEGQIHEYFQQIIEQMGNRSVSEMISGDRGFERRIHPSAAIGNQGFGAQLFQSYGVENNFLLEKLQANLSDDDPGTVWDPDPTVLENIWKHLYERVKDKVTNGPAITAFNQAIKYFVGIFSNPEQMSNLLIKGFLSVLEGLAEAGVEAVSIAVDILFTVVETAFAAITALWNQEVDIPVISWLFSKIAGGAKLTPLNLATLIVAVPVTIIYKAINEGKAPFSASDLKWFQDHPLPNPFASAVEDRMMLEVGVATDDECPDNICPSRISARTWQQIYSACYLLWGILEPLSDAQTFFDNARSAVYQNPTPKWATRVNRFRAFRLGTKPAGVETFMNAIIFLVPVSNQVWSWLPAGPGSSYKSMSEITASQKADIALWSLKTIGSGLDLISMALVYLRDKISARGRVVPQVIYVAPAGGGAPGGVANAGASAANPAAGLQRSGYMFRNVQPVLTSVLLGGSIMITSIVLFKLERDEEVEGAGLKFAQNFCEAMPVCLKFLSYEKLVEISEGWTLVGLLAADLLFDEAAGIISFNRLPSS
ncbi:MAG: LamG domain-containing protein [Myxococcota bacterium]|nr:LamG domain-containing protein [Myxococcota bacterium]